jgi:hypothetical protein
LPTRTSVTETLTLATSDSGIVFEFIDLSIFVFICDY